MDPCPEHLDSPFQITLCRQHDCSGNIPMECFEAELFRHLVKHRTLPRKAAEPLP